MDAKEYLESIRSQDTIINGMLKERDQLAAMRYRITQELKQEMVSGGGSQGGFTDASDRLIDFEREIDREVDRLVDMKREAGAMLKRLKNPKHYDVLHRHYILHDSLERIAADMGYTYRWVCILHGRALQCFQKVLDRHET
jgi:hypothetical protein